MRCTSKIQISSPCVVALEKSYLHIIQVTWALSGSQPYLAKVMGLAFNMDKMVGNDFEIGLANLKVIAEK